MADNLVAIMVEDGQDSLGTPYWTIYYRDHMVLVQESYTIASEVVWLLNRDGPTPCSEIGEVVDAIKGAMKAYKGGNQP